MGKPRECQYQSHFKTQKPMKTLSKSVKITYISRPLMVRACDASEFRALVQELTGKDSNKLIEDRDTPTWSNKEATMAAQDVEGPSYYNRMDSLEFDEDYLWKEVAQNMSVLQSPCVLV